MGFVVNNVVKMRWDEKGFIAPKVKNSGKVRFMLAIEEYKNKDGETVPVFFTTDSAFMFVEGYGTPTEKVWSLTEMRDWVISVRDTSYHLYDEYAPVIASGESECIANVLEKYGIEEWKSDIEKRLDDIRPYGYERDSAGNIID